MAVRRKTRSNPIINTDVPDRPHGDQWWQVRSTNRGIWASPQQLMDDCMAYFEWLSNNPLQRERSTPNGASVENIPRPATIRGLRLHLGISEAGLKRYRDRPGFGEVMAFVDDAIFEQKFVWAAAGVYNAMLISRDLGIKEGGDFNASFGGGSFEVSRIELIPLQRKTNGDAPDSDS